MKDSNLILVMREDSLPAVFRHPECKEFISTAKQEDFISVFEAATDPTNLGWIERDKAESDNRYKQLIPYGLVFRGAGSQVLRYFRGSGGAEERLRGKASLGLGGHVDKSRSMAAAVGRDSSESVMGGLLEDLMREVSEEMVVNEVEFDDGVTADLSMDVSLSGFLIDNTTEVGRVHIGIVFSVELFRKRKGFREPASTFTLETMEEDQIKSMEFIDFKKAAELPEGSEEFQNFETWSQILLKSAYPSK